MVVVGLIAVVLSVAKTAKLGGARTLKTNIPVPVFARAIFFIVGLASVVEGLRLIFLCG
jgi:hypothetical protein